MTVNAVRLNHAVLYVADLERLDLPSEVRRWAGVRTAAELVPVDPS